MDQYIAFISYRHRQPDQAVAIRLHKMLEHYNIPKNLRSGGQKRLGKVFRDEDELPLSTDLGESIRTALENSEFLIAICTPEYQKSKWCMEELNSFIAMHGRDHVVAVLAEGTPEESFPPQLLFTLDEDGSQKAIEPLAANIVAPSLGQSLKKLKTEKLRLIASMLNCSYDSLYQREKRYQQRRVLAFSGIALSVAAVFIGMLLSKNAQIQEQYEETRRNLLQVQLDESVSLTENARNDLLLGRRSDAVRTLLRALPEDGRPFDPTAEGVLAEALRVYEDKAITFSANISQDSDIEAWTLSDDGSLAFTWDSFGVVRGYSASNGNLLWQNTTGSKPTSRSDREILWMESTSGILCISESRVFLLAAGSGQEVWNYDSEKQSIYAALPGVSTDDIVLVRGSNDPLFTITRLDLASGSVLEDKTASASGTSRHIIGHAVASQSGPCAAVVESVLEEGNQRIWNLLIVDRNTLEINKIPIRSANPADFSVELSVAPNGLLSMAIFERKDFSKLTIDLQIIDMESGDIMSSMSADGTLTSSILDLQTNLACSDEYALATCNGGLYAFSMNGSLPIRSVAMRSWVADIVKPSHYLSQYLFICTFDNGLTSLLVCDDEDIILSHEIWKSSFNSTIQFHSARIFPGTEITTAIPENRANELLIIREEKPDTVEPVFTQEFSNQAVSPSGEKVFIGAAGSYVILSVPENRILTELPFERGKFYSFGYNNTAVFTSDEEHIIIDKWLFSLADGAIDPLHDLEQESVKRPVSVWVPALGKAETAMQTEKWIVDDYEKRFFRLYLDGEERELVSLPEGYSYFKSYSEDDLWELGGNGLLLIGAVPESDRSAPWKLLLYDTVNGQWCGLSEKITLSSHAAAASANKRPWFALHDGNRLTLYDPASGQPLWEKETDYVSESISGLWSSPDDSLLLVTYGSQRLAVYRTADGQLLSDLPFSFLSGHFLRLQQSEDGRLYVFTSTNYGYDDALILDAETGALLTRIHGAFYANLQTGHIYINSHASETTVCYPLYSLDDLREAARNYIE